MVCYYSKSIVMANDEMFVLEGETNKALSLTNKTFYSNKEIFLSELINNASDVSSSLIRFYIYTFLFCNFYRSLYVYTGFG